MKIAIPIGFGETTYKINKAYVEYVVASKMTPVIITPDTIRLVGDCKGLLLPGGIDIDPMYYGIDNYTSYNIDPNKDVFERAVFYKAIKHQLPIFGICRGFQLIMYETLLTCNDTEQLPIAFIQHTAGHAQSEHLTSNRNVRTHMVNINSKILYGIKDIPKIGVNSMHHQGVVLYDSDKNLKTFQGQHKNIKIVAWTNKSMPAKEEKAILIEGIKVNLWGNSIVGVQWHPEELMDTELLSYFFNQSYKSLSKNNFSAGSIPQEEAVMEVANNV